MFPVMVRLHVMYRTSPRLGALAYTALRVGRVLTAAPSAARRGS